jgi:hypothetical protein
MMTMVLSGSNGITFPDSTDQGTGYANGIGFRNRIINGDMRIDQRNAGASVSTDSAFPLDRFKVRTNVTGATFTSQRSTTAPTSDFVNSLVYTTGTGANAGSAEVAAILHQIEGTNVSDLGWGTANAKTVTISFRVRSSVTGTFVLTLRNSAGNRNYPATYTISSADTWETKSITVAGDTSGTWLTDTGIGLQLWFDLGSGSNYNGTANAWTGSTIVRVSGSANVIGVSSATFYITGVQLEVGSVATPFERRPFGTELALCQRYLPAYRRNGNDPICMGQTTSNTSAVFVFPLPVTPRVAPTGVVISGASDFYVVNPNASAGFVCSALTVSLATNVSAGFNATFPNNSGTAGQANILHSNTANAFFYFTGCEL